MNNEKECSDFEQGYKQGKADEKQRIISKIRVGLGSVKTFEIDTPSMHRNITYYDARRVLNLLSEIANEVEA